MSSQKELSENLDAIDSIKTITSIYQEIASFRMNQLRDKVDKTREFLEGVASVYHRTKSAYLASIQSQPLKIKKKKSSELSFLTRNGKKLNVVLTANEHLYGTLILDVWGHFINNLKLEKTEAVIVGSFGKYLINNENIDTEIHVFDLEDDQPRTDQIKRVVDFIGNYEQVSVFHGQMQSVLNQTSVRSEISGGVSYGQKIQKSTKKYLFEPDPMTILEFFETEIIAALFNQTILEHQLARFAARMVAMDQATENANEQAKKILFSIRNLRKRIMNRKQLDLFAGYSLWRDVRKNKFDDIEKILKGFS